MCKRERRGVASTHPVKDKDLHPFPNVSDAMFVVRWLEFVGWGRMYVCILVQPDIQSGVRNKRDG